MKLRAIIETEIAGKMIRLPVFPSRKTSFFKSQEKAVRAMERKTRNWQQQARGIVLPAGMTLADADWSQVYTIRLA